MLLSKNSKESLKIVIIKTLICLMDPLVVVSDIEPDYDSPIGIIMPIIENLFKIADKARKESYKDVGA